MHKLFRPLAALAALLAAAVAPAATTGPAGSDAAAPAEIRPALWKVADRDTTIYLFGTVHALPKGIAWYGGAVAEAFEGADELVTEIAETSPAQLEGLVAARATLPRGETLRALLSPEQTARLEAALAGYGLPARTFDGYEPWFAAVGLATLPLTRTGFDPANGVESLLDARARALGHPHGALETAEYQLGLFDSLPAEVQTRYLMEVVDALPTLGADLTAMVEAWKVGDAERLAALMNAQADDPALLERLLYARNKAWAQWIKARLARPGAVFVAVGAGHLAGHGSVQAELRRRGVRAVRVQ